MTQQPFFVVGVGGRGAIARGGETWTRAASGGQRGRERVGEGGGLRREGGKRRKQKAIAYERQLAPLMARETKQRSEASSSNTIKPASLAPADKRGREARGEAAEKLRSTGDGAG